MKKIPNDCNYCANVYNHRPYSVMSGFDINFIQHIRNEMDNYIKKMGSCLDCKEYYLCDNPNWKLIKDRNLINQYNEIIKTYGINEILSLLSDMSEKNPERFFNHLLMSGLFSYALKQNKYKIIKVTYDKSLYGLLHSQLYSKANEPQRK